MDKDEKKTRIEFIKEIPPLRKKLEAVDPEKVKMAQASAEKDYQSIIEHLQDGIVLLDHEFNVIYVNDIMLQRSGSSREEVFGSNFLDYLDEKTKALLRDRYQRRQKGEDLPAQYEVEYTRKDGQRRWIEISIAVFNDPSGHPRTLAHLLDITKRKQTEEAFDKNKKQFNSLAENLPGVVFQYVLHPNGEYRPLHNTHTVIANEVKQSHNSLIFHEIATSLALLAMTKKQLCKALNRYV